MKCRNWFKTREQLVDTDNISYTKCNGDIKVKHGFSRFLYQCDTCKSSVDVDSEVSLEQLRESEQSRIDRIP